MTINLSKIFWLIVIAFMIFFVIHSPVAAGHVVSQIFNWIIIAFQRLATFLTSVLS